MGRILLQQLVRPDITCRSLWSSYPSLVSGDILDTAVIGGDAIDGHTPRKQGMGLRCSIVVLQQRINPQTRGCHLQEIAPMRPAGSERRVLRVLDEVIALRGEIPQNVWAGGSLVSRDQAVSHYQLICAVGSTVPDTTATLGTGVAIDGAKDQLRLGTSTTVEDATTGPLSSIILDRAVDQRERPGVGDATTAVSQIP
jgi:hypothetical protein